ncbi:MAG: M20/M25/M40 family metallo-hydrolase [Gemmatimonadetes bacterium]|jgi:tripeptide aminopeptidase|nr:M20/M25/M40 family metallo-hydrolase [Gemmatimonadota bacterium]
MPASNGAVRRVYDALLPARRHLQTFDSQTIDRQVALAEVAAPTGAEGARAAEVCRHWRAIGLEATIDAAGNVIAPRAGTSDRPPVVVCAHLDTVFDADVSHRMTRSGERITGPGIGDNARGIAGMLAIAHAMHVTGVRTQHPILFVATTGEEGSGNLRGARHLFATAAAGAHAAIALDGAGDERVVTHALGTRRYRVRFAGPGGHSWASYGVVNAIHAVSALAASLASWPLPAAPRTALTVSRISGGSAVNAIPSDASIEVDVRSTSGGELDRLDDEIHAAAQRVLETHNRQRRPGTPPLQLAIEITGDRPGGALPGNAFLGQAAYDATRLIGRSPDSAVASTDANIPLHLGIPAIALGAGGRGGEVHTPREWFENRDGTLGLVRAMTILAAAAGLP